ncbi:MAG: hypothetical protein IJX62_08670 [Clostridia bacterium]|nr:hypothetical protein [Clostridia bacterium]
MQKKIHVITVATFLVLIFGFAVAFLLVPDREFSEQENRSLRTLPEFSWQALASGEYASQINDYFADQFPLRDGLVGLKGLAEIAMGKGENDGILLGRDGQMARRLYDAVRVDGSTVADTDVFDPAQVSAATDGINRVAESMDLPFTVILTGRTLDVAASAFDYPTNASDALLAQIRGELGDHVNAPDMVARHRTLYENGEQVYYRTDHHWTTLGAYYAYAEILRSYGMEGEILPMDAFERRVVSEDFYGTYWSAGGMKFVKPDEVEFWLLGNEDEFTVTADGRELEGFYSTRYLSMKDKYSAFLDGTHDVVTVTKNTEEERPTLVLFKDSFANSVAPFLAQHFDLVLLNLSSVRTDYTDVTAYAEEYGADYVLVIYTLENVITAQKMNRLR